jgi:hypothetical protein
MIDLTGVLHVLGASTATMKNSPAHSSRNAVSSMGNAPVRLDLAVMTVRSQSAARWQMERGDPREKGRPVIVGRVGKESTAMFAPQIRRAMP